ncbi:hypothetical protein [Bradyrhizobium sp. BWA-3-5]|uniref:hypothetical protein n=1 Tax=Bradyrhizobium sp. BWA-3-5 TaxID=3080013 RepID=UPI00293E1F56|nr:hypothetical protein [Bradyrhizobium sp. BWA-3-5]WOH64078.1 hypothetical protein RX331_26175 [Bradyrhizobium sp. BWA-3-5]WOH64204.1 hypothetical protein RX331_26965 [Bradyrhizobium sp. BWA-3-5]WOH70127.1 hypothetical protein RX331_38110 [Bradyrhizobium sp. BWA-3-5]
MKGRRRSRATNFRASATVGSELRRLFPNGTNPDTGRWSYPPALPAELFGAVAHLLEASGAYTYIVAPFASTRGVPKVSYSGATQAPRETQLVAWRRIGKRWASNVFKEQPEIVELWAELWACRNHVLVAGQNSRPRLSWWKSAHALLVIADEASTNCGYETFDDDGADPNWANKLASYLLINRTGKLVIPSSRSRSDDRHLSRHVALDSLAVDASRDVVRVLPKGRTTDVGCTMRTLSHNLTMLRPHGHPNVYWHQQLWSSTSDRHDSLSVLLIPFPYDIPDGCFKGDIHNGPADMKWGRFRVEQKWLYPKVGDCHWSDRSARRSFVDFVNELLLRANKDVHGVVLPEYSLDWATYDELVRYLRDEWPAIEFLIAGVSEDCNRRKGNQVVFSVMHQELGNRIAETHSRRKHHRWRLDDTQIRTYGLQADLSTDCIWWEYLEIEERVLHIDVFRSQSAFTAVICEDLARADPVVSEIRSLGPNLIFALLMDGPQMKERWPGLYATNLADDPGSSVLTLTSFALIKRSNATFGRNKRTIALWRNRPTNLSSRAAKDFVELDLADDAQAVVVNLRSTPAVDVTIDGRQDRNTTSWQFEHARQVGIPSDEIDARGWRWIVPY